MKSKFRLLFPVILIAFVFSCRDSPVSVTETNQAALFHAVSVKEAKDNVSEFHRSARISDGSFWSKVVPLWDFAFQAVDPGGLGTYLVVPTQHDPFLNLVKEADGSFVERKSPPIRLVVFKDKRGVLQSYYYVVNENRQKLGGKDWIQSFSGSLMYYSLNGELVFKRQYKDGHRVFTIDELPGGPSKGGRCGWGKACYYTWLEVTSAPLVKFHGYDEENFIACDQTVNVSGNIYTLTDVQTVWMCDNEDPRFPPDPYPQPQPGGSNNGGQGMKGAWRNSAMPIFVDVIKNELQNPCFSGIAENLFASASGNTQIMGEEITKVFNLLLSPNSMTITLKEGNDLNPGQYGRFRYVTDPNTNEQWGEITLNQGALQNASKEFVAATIIHEMIHGMYFQQTGVPLNQSQQHQQMATEYVDPMANALVAVYNLSQTHANALAWGGLEGHGNWYNLTPFQRNTIIGINNLHRNGTAGTKCN